ncbi:MAG TPA: hypothetical protein VI408_05335 [Gaiellaceae bacterium]
MRALFAALTVTVAAGVHHTAAGNAAAHTALLTHSDLGAAWITGATPKKVGSLVCSGTSSVKGVTETGAAVGPTYRRSAAGPFVSESTFVYDSAVGAARYYGQVARPNALACLAQGLILGGNPAKGVSFTVTKRLALVAPHVSAAAVEYRVIGRAVTQAQRVTVYLDVVLLQKGATISELAFSSFSAPVSAGEELRIARAATARL